MYLYNWLKINRFIDKSVDMATLCISYYLVTAMQLDDRRNLIIVHLCHLWHVGHSVHMCAHVLSPAKLLPLLRSLTLPRLDCALRAQVDLSCGLPPPRASLYVSRREYFAVNHDDGGVCDASCGSCGLSIAAFALFSAFVDNRERRRRRQRQRCCAATVRSSLGFGARWASGGVDVTSVHCVGLWSLPARYFFFFSPISIYFFKCVRECVRVPSICMCDTLQLLLLFLLPHLLLLLLHYLLLARFCCVVDTLFLLALSFALSFVRCRRGRRADCDIIC